MLHSSRHQWYPARASANRLAKTEPAWSLSYIFKSQLLKLIQFRGVAGFTIVLLMPRPWLLIEWWSTICSNNLLNIIYQDRLASRGIQTRDVSKRFSRDLNLVLAKDFLAHVLWTSSFSGILHSSKCPNLISQIKPKTQGLRGCRFQAEKLSRAGAPKSKATEMPLRMEFYPNGCAATKKDPDRVARFVLDSKHKAYNSRAF